MKNLLQKFWLIYMEDLIISEKEWTVTRNDVRIELPTKPNQMGSHLKTF